MIHNIDDAIDNCKKNKLEEPEIKDQKELYNTYISNSKNIYGDNCVGDIINELNLMDFLFLEDFYFKFNKNNEIAIKNYLINYNKYHIWNINVMLESIKEINFEWEFYRSHYDDLNNLKDEYSCFRHYINYGLLEKRIINLDNLVKNDNRYILLIVSYNLNEDIKPLNDNYIIIKDTWIDHKRNNSDKYSIKCLNYANIIVCNKNIIWYSINKIKNQLLFIKIDSEINKEFINNEYINKEFINKEFINKEFINEALINEEFINKEYEEFIHEANCINEIKWINEVKWINVNKIFLTSEKNKQFFLTNVQNVPNLLYKIIILNDFNNRNLFDIQKNNSCIYNVGFLIFEPIKTNTIKAIELFLTLKNKNPLFKLFINGDISYNIKNKDEFDYYKKFNLLVTKYPNNIFIENTNNFMGWFSKIGTILVFNTDKKTIEFTKMGMMAGCIPFISDFNNDDNMFPSKFYNIFNVWNTKLCNESREFIKKNHTQFIDKIREEKCIKLFVKVIDLLTDYKDILANCKDINKDIDTFNSVNINFLNMKEQHRYNCYWLLPSIKNTIIVDIEKNCINETVLIEFRELINLEFLIRNTIIKLPDWSHTIVCGNNNHLFIENICKSITNNITIIKLDIDNLTPSDYSKLLMSVDFWNNFKGEKILLYQEDTMLFHNNIEEFLKYDYIGASWPPSQDDNSYGVGNGGFSLRNREKMIECIIKINPKDLELGESTLDYIKNTNSTHIPEDVFFSKSLIDYNLGLVAKRDIANKFSQETQLCKNPLGGHNFWLAKGNKLQVSVNNYEIIGIHSPYDYTIGGGESYLSNIILFFIKNGAKKIIFFSNTDNNKYYETLDHYFSKKEQKYIVKTEVLEIFQYKNKNKLDLFFHMSNGKESDIHFRIAKKQIFHCQFPFDLNNPWENGYSLKNNYDIVLLNSDFTLDNYRKTSKNMFPVEKIHILYPLCYKNDSSKNSHIFKDKPNDKIIFVTIGRIFKYDKGANNKHHDKLIRIFNKILYDFSNAELHIIGTIVHQDWYDYLNNIKHANIYIHPDINNITKNNILKKTHYIIHAAGLDKNEIVNPYVFEHFGISIIEGMRYNCIPICTDGGYPKYYINHNENGYLFKTMDDLYDIISDIVNKNIKSDMDMGKAIKQNNKLIEQFNDINYYSTMSNILINI